MAPGSGASAARPRMTRSCRSLSKVRESGAGSGARVKGTDALAPRLGRDLLEPGHQSAQIILAAADFGRIEISREPRQELWKDVRHLV